MGTIKIGTSSWTDPTLLKEAQWYPPSAKSAEARLKFYATQFALVEVDSTYYYPPSERNSVLWIERTPPRFIFNIKAYSLLTGHPTKADSLYADLRASLPPETLSARNLYRDKLPEEVVEEVFTRFHGALMPLHSAGKLGAVLFQFPQWFVIGRESRAWIEHCAARLEDFRVAVEFRHRSWLSPENVEKTLAFLSSCNLPLVCVDMPQGFDSSVPPVVAATAADLSLVRFHGRNTATWEVKGISAAERFRYRYSQEELRAWVPRVASLAEQTRETHVLFNNCYRDDAVINAAEFTQLVLPVDDELDALVEREGDHGYGDQEREDSDPSAR